MLQDDGSSSVTSSSPLQNFPMMSISPSFVGGGGSPYQWLKDLKSEDRGLYLIHLLLACANHVANGNLEMLTLHLIKSPILHLLMEIQCNESPRISLNHLLIGY